MTTRPRAHRAGWKSETVCSLSEWSYEDLYERAPCGYLSSGGDGTVVTVNETFLMLTGYRREQVVGHAFSSLLSVGSASFYETRCLPRLRLKGELSEVALEIRRPDGGTMAILVNSTTHAGRDGKPRQIRTAVFPATERRAYERDLLEARRAAELAEEGLRVLHEASTTFGASQSEESLTTSLAETARAASDATSTSVMLVEQAGLRLVAGSWPLTPCEHLDSGRPEAEALRTGKLVTVASIEEASRRFPALVEPLTAARLEAFCVVPLTDDGATLGLLYCFFGRRRDFDERTLELQSALARYACQVLVRLRLQSELRHMAVHDQLTGLANRDLLQHRLTQVLVRAERDERPVALMFLDLDGFKAINDHLGHIVGDSVLTQVSDRLRQAVRRGDDVARFGGDEFVVVCGDTDPQAVMLVAERIRDAIREPMAGVPSLFPLTASIGVAVHLPDGRATLTTDAMVSKADDAMYESKRRGKDRVTLVTV